MVLSYCTFYVVCNLEIIVAIKGYLKKYLVTTAIALIRCRGGIILGVVSQNWTIVQPITDRFELGHQSH